MDTVRLIDVLRGQRGQGFTGLSGTRIDATAAIDAALLNEMIGAALPPGGPVADVVAHPLDGQQIRVSLRVSRMSFLPRLTVTLAIVAQPSPPERMMLVLRLAGAGGLMALAGPALRLLDVLPAGIGIAGDLVHVDVRALLSERGLGDLLPLLERLEIQTEEGRIHVRIGARVP